MMKMYVTIVVVLQVVGVIYGNLIGDLLGAVLQNAIRLPEDAQSINVTLGILGPLGFIGPAGYISFPFNTICKIPVVGEDYLFCALCNQDCVFVHNTFGGNCGPSPTGAGTTCLCANSPEEADTRDITTSTTGTCGIIPATISYLQDALVRDFLRIRMGLIQCLKSNGIYESSGCVSDCRDNHGYLTGRCVETMPIAPNTGNTPTLHSTLHLLFRYFDISLN